MLLIAFRSLGFFSSMELPEREVSAKITGSTVAELFLKTPKNDRFALVT